MAKPSSNLSLSFRLWDVKFTQNLTTGEWEAQPGTGEPIRGKDLEEVNAKLHEAAQQQRLLKEQAQQGQGEQAPASPQAGVPAAKNQAHIRLVVNQQTNHYDTFLRVHSDGTFSRIDPATGDDLPNEPQDFRSRTYDTSLSLSHLTAETKLPRAKIERLANQLASDEIRGEIYAYQRHVPERVDEALGTVHEVLYTRDGRSGKVEYFGDPAWKIFNLDEPEFAVRMDEWSRVPGQPDALRHAKGALVIVAPQVDYTRSENETPKVKALYVVGTDKKTLSHEPFDDLDIAMRVAQELGELASTPTHPKPNTLVRPSHWLGHGGGTFYPMYIQGVLVSEKMTPRLLSQTKLDHGNEFVTRVRGLPDSRARVRHYVTRDLDRARTIEKAVAEFLAVGEEVSKGGAHYHDTSTWRVGKINPVPKGPMVDLEDKEALDAQLDVLRKAYEKIDQARQAAVAERRSKLDKVKGKLERLLTGSPQTEAKAARKKVP